MKVEFGNDHAIQTIRDENDHEVTVPYPGQHVTTMEIPDDMSINEAFITLTHPTKGALSKHIESGGKPVWIESDSPLMLALLQDHYGVTKSKPKSWGKKKD